MSELILHHYDASPFTQRALRMLGLKGLAWRSVVTPMMPPKDALLALTGGYRGTPVLQIGAHVYIDSQRIAAELECRFPRPTFFPDHNPGLSLALVKWADAFFRSGLHMAIALTSDAWPPEFAADRRTLFADLDFEKVKRDLPHAQSQLRAHASFIEVQLADGRRFLTGDEPALADIHAITVPWFTRAAMPVVNELLADFTHVAPWEARVAELGEGTRTPTDAAYAFEIARSSARDFAVDIEPRDAQGLRAGMRVTVLPDDSQRGAVEGEVVIARANEIAIRRVHPACGEVLVHFPRLGYRVSPLG